MIRAAVSAALRRRRMCDARAGSRGCRRRPRCRGSRSARRAGALGDELGHGARLEEPERPIRAPRDARRHRPARLCRRSTGCPARDRAASAGCRSTPGRSRAIAWRRICFSRRPLSFSAAGSAPRTRPRGDRGTGKRPSTAWAIATRSPCARQDVAGQEEARFEVLRLGERMPAAEIARAGWRGDRRARRSRRVAARRSLGEEQLGAGGRAEARQVREERIVESVEAGREEGLAR